MIVFLVSNRQKTTNMYPANRTKLLVTSQPKDKQTLIEFNRNYRITNNFRLIN